MNLNNEVSPEHYFHLTDGRVLKSAKELFEALKDMDDEVFKHHVTPEKNDFVDWINFISTLDE